jgi:hypothetical protein
MAFLISWQVKGNPPREKIVSLEKTANDYKNTWSDSPVTSCCISRSII